MPGVNSVTAHTLWSEVGPDLYNFPNAAAWASGRGRCPDNRISPDFSPDFGAFSGRSEGRGLNPAKDAAANALFVSRPAPLERTNGWGRETRG